MASTLKPVETQNFVARREGLIAGAAASERFAADQHQHAHGVAAPHHAERRDDLRPAKASERRHQQDQRHDDAGDGPVPERHFAVGTHVEVGGAQILDRAEAADPPHPAEPHHRLDGDADGGRPTQRLAPGRTVAAGRQPG